MIEAEYNEKCGLLDSNEKLLGGYQQGNMMSSSDANIQLSNERDKRRWGKVIDMKSYTPGSCIRLLVLVIAILLVPMQLFCDGLVGEKE